MKITRAALWPKLWKSLGSYDAKLAEKMGPSNGRPNEHWHAAREDYQKGLDIYRDMKNKKMLSVADAGKPDELIRDVANCEAALAQARK